MAEDSIDEIRKQLKDANARIALLQAKVQSFELPGRIKLYYSLNRNMNDLADMLNKVNLKDVNIDDPKDKSMERMKIIWASIASLSTTLSTLSESSGITGDEAKDTARKASFLDKYAN